MSMEIKRATRSGVIPLIALYSESGCGKTYSALLLARGLVGSSGEIHVIDTESRRASLYADVIPGGFQVLDLDGPFSPARYIEALDTVYAAGAKVAVVDSMSHEWEGIGGVLEMAGDNEARSGKSGLHNWRAPKLEHAKLVTHLLRAPIPVILCIRAKYKTRSTKDERGKTVIVKDDVISPIQADDFIFEMTAHAEIKPDHSALLTKCSHPDLRTCFPDKGPITSDHGAKIARWCIQGPAGPSANGPMDEMRKALWKALEPIRGKEVPANWRKANEFLRGIGAIADGEEAQKSPTPERFHEILEAAKKHLE